MRKALLVMDMLKDFIEPEGALYCGPQVEDIVPFIKKKIESFRANGDLVIFVCDRHEEDDLEFQRFPRHCVEGTDGAMVIEELRYEGYEMDITGKQRYSAFFNTDLDEQLEDIEEVELVGVCTNICVLYTAEGLCSRDKKVTVYRDGVASFDEIAQELSLSQMEGVLGVTVL